MTPKYPNLGLNRNPFVISVERDITRIEEIIEDVRRFCPDIRSLEYKLIKDRFLDPLVKGDDPATILNLWVQGEKGVGKSILLKKLALDLYGSPDIMTIYVKVPEQGLDLAGIYGRSVTWLAAEKFGVLSRQIYLRHFREMTLNESARVFDLPGDTLKAFVKDFKLAAKKDPETVLGMFSKDPRAIKALRKLKVDPGLIKLKVLKRQVAGKLVARHGIYKKFADLISEYLDDPNGAFMAIQSAKGRDTVPMLLSYFRAARDFLDARAIVLILDEYEISWRQMSDAKKLAMVVAIRALNDSSKGQMKFILTVVSDVFDDIATAKFRHILDVIPKSPIGRNIIDVKAIDDSQAMMLVDFLLNGEGVRSRSGKYIDPFVPEAIVALNKHAQAAGGATRQLVVELRDTLDEAEERGKKVIDKACLLEISPVYDKFF